MLAPHAADRAFIVPTPPTAPPAATTDDASADTPAARLQRLSWASLLARLWQIEATLCPRCGGRMKPAAALTDPGSIRRYLAGVGLPTEPPVIAAARPPPHQGFDFLG